MDGKNRVLFVYAGLLCVGLGLPYGCSDTTNYYFPPSGGTAGSGGSNEDGDAGESSGGRPGTGGTSTQTGAGGEGAGGEGAGGEAGAQGDTGGTDAGGATGGIGGEAPVDAGGAGGVPDGSGGAPDSGGSAGTSSGGTGGTSGGNGGAAGTSGGAAGSSSGGAGGTSGGTGGSSSGGNGGNGGSGGTNCGPKVGHASNLPISDLEGGHNGISPPRTGYWGTFGDGTNMLPPPDPSGANPFAPDVSGYGGSEYYAHFTSTGGKNVGMFFDLNNCQGKPYAYDVSAYKGISLAYRSSHDLMVEVTSLATTPAPIGSCSGLCNNHHFYTLPSAAAWTPVSIPFTNLTQDFGTIAALDKTGVLMIQFHVRGAWDAQAEEQGPISPAAVDIGVDNIAFTVN
jgi:hypothetical protein